MQIIRIVGSCLVMLLAAIVSAQAQPRVSIALFVESHTPETTQRVDELTREIEAVVGQDAIIELPDLPTAAEYDLDRARAAYEAAVADESVDLILAVGATFAEAITGRAPYAKPVILFGAVDAEGSAAELSALSSGVENFTYLVTAHSFSRDLELLRQFHAFRRVAAVFPPERASAPDVTAQLDRYAAATGVTIDRIGYESVSALASALDGVDALYLAEGFGMSAEDLVEIARMALDRGIPSFTTTFGRDVEAGWLISNRNEDTIRQLVRRLALTVEGFVNGRPLSEMPVFIDDAGAITMNFNTATRLGITIPYSLIETTRFVGEFENVRAERRYTLLDVYQAILSDNLDLHLARASVETVRQDRREARSAYLPDLRVVGQGSTTDPDLVAVSPGQTEYSLAGALSLGQLIYSPDVLLNMGSQADALTAEEAALRAAELDVLLQGASVYFGALRAKASLRSQARNFTLTQQNLAVAEQNLAAGQSGQLDVLRFRSQLAQDNQSLVSAIHDLESAFIGLSEVVGDSLARQIDVEDAQIGAGVFAGYDGTMHGLLESEAARQRLVSYLVTEALRNAPERVQLEARRRTTGRALTRYGVGRFLPSLQLNANLNRRIDEWGDGVIDPNPAPEGWYDASISLDLPIFDQGRMGINRARARVQRDALDTQLEDLDRQIEQSVRNAALNAHTAATNLALSEAAEEYARQSLDLSQTAYSTGALSVLELIDVQRTYQQAELGYAIAGYDFLLAVLTLERRVGHMILLRTPAENAAFLSRFDKALEGQP